MHGVGMKRKHPTIESFFWCPKCRGYSSIDNFYRDARTKIGIAGVCREHARERVAIYRKREPEKVSEISKRAMKKINSTPQRKLANILKNKNDRLFLADNYVKDKLRKQGFNGAELGGIVEIKRQCIILKRNIRKVKEIMKNGSNIT
jgi:hypothetical protein